MPGDKETIEQFAARIKAKYPQYKDINDTDLVNRIVTKHPEYKDSVDLSGATRQTQTESPQFQQGPIGSVIPDYAPANQRIASDSRVQKATILPVQTKTVQVGPVSKEIVQTVAEKHADEVAAAQQRVNQTLQKSDGAIKNLLTDYKKQQELSGIQDQLHQRGVDATSNGEVAQRISSLIPKATIHVSEEEVKDYKNAMRDDPNLGREALHEYARLNPGEAKKIAADAYLLDSKDRSHNAEKILQNKEGIEKGNLEYSIWHGGKVQKPEGFAESLGRGFDQRTQQFNDYNFLSSAKDEDIINEMEKRRKTPHNEDEPVPVASGLSGGFGQMVGAEGPTMVKGAIPAILSGATGGGAAAAAPWLGALLTSPDFYERGYANSFTQNYNELRDQGHDAADAVAIAKNRASFDAKADVAMGALMTATGAKMGTPGIPGKLTPGFVGAVKGAVKEMAASSPEAAGVGILGGLTQMAKNIHSGKKGTEGIAEAALVPIAFHFGIKSIAAGAQIVGGTLFKSSVDNMAKQPEEAVNKTIGEQVENGEITPEKATEIYNVINEKRQQNAVLFDKAKEAVSKGAVKGVEGEPLQADINNPEKFDAHLKHIADQAHDPKTAENTVEVYGKDLVDVAKQLHPAEDIPALIEANRKFDLKEVDEEIKKLSSESEDYGKKKEALEKQKTAINDYYDNYGKHHEDINSPQIEDNGKQTETDQTLPQTNEVGKEGAAQEPVPFSNQQTEAAKGFLQQGIESGHIDKEYAPFADHADHLLNYIRDQVKAGKGNEMEQEYILELVTLSQSETSYPIVRNIKPKENATTQQEPGTVDVGQPPVNGGTMGEGNTRSEIPPGESQPEAQSQSVGQKEVIPEDDLPFRNEPGDESITGIRNSITSKNIEEAGLRPVLQEAKRTHKEVWNAALEKVKKGYDPQVLIDKLKKKPRPLTDEEDALLLIHQVDKESQLDAINRGITEAGQKGDEGQLAELGLQKVKIKDDLQEIYDIDKAVGTANARGLSARQMMSDRRYSLVAMENEASALKEGVPLTKEEKEAIEKRYNDIKDARDAIKKRVDELEAENKELKAKKSSSNHKKTKQEYAKQREEILKNMRDDLLRAARGGEGLTASVPFAAQLKAVAPHVAKLVKLYVEQGVDNITQITKDIYGLLKPTMPQLEESHIHDLISGEFNAKAPKEGEQINDQGIPLPIKEQAQQVKYAVTDPKLMKLRANYERAKEAWGDEVRRKELAGRTKSEKIQDAFVKWERAFKLSGITTMAKLAMAAATRISVTPIEEGIGGLYSKALPKTAAKATGEGGLNLKAEAKAITSAFTQGMKDSADILSKKTRGQSDIEAVFGKKGNLPPEAIGFFGQLHSATKAPVKRAAFERSMYKRIKANLKAGVDVSDPMLQAKISIQAYKDANRAIFMQDNFLSDSYRNFVNSIERSKKYPTQGKIAATALQWLIPFVKVPTNIVGEVGTHVGGVPIAAGKLLHTAFTKGIENLSEEEADMIMRNLKKGTIGAGALLLGYFNPANFGGYYEKYEKRAPGDLKAGQTRAFGLTIPVWLQESPIFQTMQLGATIRRVQDKIVHGEPEGIGKGIWAGLLGLVEHEPLVDQPARIMGAIKDPKEREYFLGQLAKGTIVPAGISNIAQWTDPAESRKPGSILESVETGIPGLRENVPEKAPPKTSGGGGKKGGKKRERRH